MTDYCLDMVLLLTPEKPFTLLCEGRKGHKGNHSCHTTTTAHESVKVTWSNKE